MAFDHLLQILEALKKRYPAFGNRMEEAQALGEWEKAVGPAIAKHSSAVGVENGMLLVEVDHPIWKSELHHRKRQILDILNSAAAPGINAPLTDIRLLDRRSTKRF